MDKIIYHKNCADGFCSAWIARTYIGNKAEYIAANYNEPLPDNLTKDSDIYLLDFSYKKEQIIELCDKCQFVTILDHHKTAKEELDGLNRHNLHIVFDMEKSGATLTWEAFDIGCVKPWLIPYVEDRDLWRWKLEHSREINACIGSYDFTFEAWDELNARGIESAILEGAGILRANAKIIKNQAEFAKEGVIEGIKIPVLNSTVLISEINEAMYKGKPFSATWFHDGTSFIYSLRSDVNGMDVSEIAKKYGGGGHKHAAGFKSKQLIHIESTH